MSKSETRNTRSPGAIGSKSEKRARPGKGVLYKILLTASRNSNGDVEFEPRNKFWHPATNSFRFRKGGLDHPGMAARDYHLVEFRLQNDQTGLNLRFPSNPEDAMWVVNRPACPTPDDEKEYDVARPLAVINEHTLLALNLNKVCGQFGFRLNFVGNGSSEYVPWDPIGENQNGGLH